MSNALSGEQYCDKHQGNHSHYDPKNCLVCQLAKKGNGMAQRDLTELEATVTAWREKGMAWVDAKLAADLLEKDKDSLLASIIGTLRYVDPKASDVKLKAEAQASVEYREFIKGMVLAKHKELTARVEYDALDKLFSARQSDQSMERAKLERGIFHTGGK